MHTSTALQLYAICIPYFSHVWSTKRQFSKKRTQFSAIHTWLCVLQKSTFPCAGNTSRKLKWWRMNSWRHISTAAILKDSVGLSVVVEFAWFSFDVIIFYQNSWPQAISQNTDGWRSYIASSQEIASCYKSKNKHSFVCSHLSLSCCRSNHGNRWWILSLWQLLPSRCSSLFSVLLPLIKIIFCKIKKAEGCL